MMLKKTILATSLLLSSVTGFASQDILIENHTELYATAKLKFSLCSSILAGSAGILKPHGNLTIPKIVEDLYCSNGCNVEIYASQNCSGNSIFTAHIDTSSGVTSVATHTSDYHVTGSGHDIALEGGHGIKSWLKRLFG